MTTFHLVALATVALWALLILVFFVLCERSGVDPDEPPPHAHDSEPPAVPDFAGGWVVPSPTSRGWRPY